MLGTHDKSLLSLQQLTLWRITLNNQAKEQNLLLASLLLHLRLPDEGPEYLISLEVLECYYKGYS